MNAPDEHKKAPSALRLALWLSGAAVAAGVLLGDAVAQTLGVAHRPKPDMARLHYDLQPRASG